MTRFPDVESAARPKYGEGRVPERRGWCGKLRAGAYNSRRARVGEKSDLFSILQKTIGPMVVTLH